MSSFQEEFILLLSLCSFVRSAHRRSDCEQLLREKHPMAYHGVNDTLEDFTDKILCRANGKVRPNAKGKEETIARVQLFVNGIFDLSELNMQMSIDLYFRQTWRDDRLQYSAPSLKEPISLRTHHLHDIWMPDPIFVNERKGTKHDITVPNVSLRLYENGTIQYSQRLTLSLSCPMDLHNYPMDKQECPLRIESYNYDEAELVFVFADEDPVKFRPDTNVPEYFIDNYADTHNCSSHYATGNYSCIEAVFHIRRDFGYYFIQVYIPCFLIVGLSWISFLLDVHATPARVSLGLLTVLTMTTQSTGSRAQLPRVSYVNAMDVWLATCLIFVFAALLEYSVVNVLARKEDQKLREAYIQQGKKRSSISSALILSEKEREQPRDLEDAILKLFKVLELDEGQRVDEVYTRRASYRVEYGARILFPLAFIVFNIFYWTYYPESL